MVVVVGRQFGSFAVGGHGLWFPAFACSRAGAGFLLHRQLTGLNPNGAHRGWARAGICQEKKRSAGGRSGAGRADVGGAFWFTRPPGFVCR